MISREGRSVGADRRGLDQDRRSGGRAAGVAAGQAVFGKTAPRPVPRAGGGTRRRGRPVPTAPVGSVSMIKTDESRSRQTNREAELPRVFAWKRTRIDFLLCSRHSFRRGLTTPSSRPSGPDCPG